MKFSSAFLLAGFLDLNKFIIPENTLPILFFFFVDCKKTSAFGIYLLAELLLS